MINIIRLNSQFSSIVESGSNENGSYIKYSDGTMICYGYTNANIANTEYHYLHSTWYYPKKFIEAPRVFGTPADWSTYVLTTKIAPDLEFCSVMTHGIDPFTNALADLGVVSVMLVAIGRWK